LDLLCDVCVEIGRERRIGKLAAEGGQEDGKKDSLGGMPGTQDGKVTVFDFSEIMERTEKRVGDEVLGAGPQNVDELRAIARRVKSKYLMRIQLKEKHLVNPKMASPLGKQIPPMPSKESVKNAFADMGGGLRSMLKSPTSTANKGTNAAANDVKNGDAPETTPGGQEVEVHFDGTTSSPAGEDVPVPPKSPANPFASPTLSPDVVDADEMDDLDKLSAELGELSAVTEAFDLLGDDFDTAANDADLHPEDLLDAMDVKVDPMAAFAIDDDEFLS